MGRLYEQLALRAWNAGLSEEGKFIPDVTGKAKASLGLLERAMHAYAAAASLAAPDANAWGRLGWAYGVRARIVTVSDRASEGVVDVERARAGMRQAIAMNPNNRYHHEVLASYGLSRLEVERPTAGLADPVVREGLQALQRSVELDPRVLPEALMRLLRYTKEADLLVLVIPEQSVDCLYAARLLEDQEFWPQAKVFYKQAIDLAPDDGKPLFYQEYAQALSRRGEDQEASDVLQVVLRFDPQNLDLRLALAMGLTRLKRTAEAAKVYEEALDLANAALQTERPVPAPAPWQPKRPKAHPSREERVLAEIQARFPKEQRTADSLTRALAGLAAFYHGQGRDDLAVPLWEKAIARTPDDPPTAFGLAKSYDAVGAWVSAVDYYKRAIELNKGNLEYRLTLADRYYENDMTFQAINLWRDVVAVRPSLLDARLKLAAAYTKLEQYPDALREYERVLQLDPKNSRAREGIMRLRGRLPG
jgi:tetratricopeptide (TPR) repeat protein